ncbi:GNAT family N-acetyltransferase [Planococcus shixiaomingii]|uniref:GNAT family N-acetyltransferase n=1 Tax=Planococcus shixiaomingii TaxID=3058393 RepID=UPI00260BB6D3|nr:GNAT family protein [Planococcus sp. N022]WKA54665.1 GNAT family protein [Planococcus sp. N022]
MADTYETDNHFPVLETERLILRKLTLADAEDMFEYASEPMVSRFVPWEVHKSVEDTKAFLAFLTESYGKKRKLTWAIELKSEGKMIGTIDFINWLPKRHKAELAYILSHNYWGSGLILEAAKSLLDYGFQKMELNKVEAPIMLDNFQSQRVVEKLGMQREGVARQHMIINGEFVDLAMYSILKREYVSGS